VGKPPIIIGVDENDRQGAEKMEQQKRWSSREDSKWRLILFRREIQQQLSLFLV
jgi:hypothetical protein